MRFLLCDDWMLAIMLTVDTNVHYKNEFGIWSEWSFDRNFGLSQPRDCLKTPVPLRLHVRVLEYPSDGRGCV